MQPFWIMVRIKLNGSDREVPADVTLAALLDWLGLRDQPLLVEYNGLALLRSEWDTKSVSEGDVLELVRVVAGG